MLRINPSRIAVTFKAKLALVIFGIFLFLVLLEIALRLGGFLLLSMQEYRNLQSLKQKGAYRIICLGESTTQGQYPIFLEATLNQRKTGIKFSIIDKGIAGTDTTTILSQLESNLKQYNPDMVIVMMGINDLGPHIPYESATTSKVTLFLQSLRTYKLARLLWLHIVVKTKELGFFYLPAIRLQEAYAESSTTEDALKKAIELNPKDDKAYIELGLYYQNQGKLYPAGDAFKEAIKINPKNYSTYAELGGCYLKQGKLSQAGDAFNKDDRAYVELGLFYQSQGKLSQAEDAFTKAIKLNPKNDRACLELGWCYQRQGKYYQAGDAFKKATEANPKNDSAYVNLGWCYANQGKLSQTEDAFKKAIELNPKNDRVYLELGWHYQNQGKLSQATGALKKAAELNPKDGNAYLGLGWCYQNQGKYSLAGDAFKRATETNPKDDRICLELGRCYIKQSKFSQAKYSFTKAIELNPESDIAYGAISLLYEQTGKPELARKYAKKATSLRLKYHNPATVSNYLKLKRTLDERGIKLVCVQYPMRSIEPLKKIFAADAKGIVFVDNEEIFRSAIKKDGVSVYFKDMFGGDFGHCTEKGNRLLAENIVNVILKEVFHK